MTKKGRSNFAVKIFSCSYPRSSPHLIPDFSSPIILNAWSYVTLSKGGFTFSNSSGFLSKSASSVLHFSTSSATMWLNNRSSTSIIQFRSHQGASASTCQYSVKCLLVRDFSALKDGATV